MTPRRKGYPIDIIPVTKKAREARLERLELERMLAEYHAAKKREVVESGETIRLRIRYIVRKYGVSESELQEMLSSQGRSCAICKKGFEGLDCCVDHNHITGEVRGLLCGRCNTLIGGWDDPVFARKAAGYLGIIPKEKGPIEIYLERKKGSST